MFQYFVKIRSIYADCTIFAMFFNCSIDPQTINDKHVCALDISVIERLRDIETKNVKQQHNLLLRV